MQVRYRQTAFTEPLAECGLKAVIEEDVQVTNDGCTTCPCVRQGACLPLTAYCVCYRALTALMAPLVEHL